MVAARARYVRALDARDDISHAKVRRGLAAGLFATCMVGGAAVAYVGGKYAEDLGVSLAAITGGLLAGGACYAGILKTIIGRRDGIPDSGRADAALSSARADLRSATASYGGKLSSLLRRPAPRLGFGLTIADGLALGETTAHSGFAVEGGLHANWRWLHPELAIELNAGQSTVVVRPGVRLTLGRWFFLRGAGERALAGGGDAWSVFGGAGVDLWFTKHLAFEIAGDYSHSLADVGGISHVRLRTASATASDGSSLEARSARSAAIRASVPLGTVVEEGRPLPNAEEAPPTMICSGSWEQGAQAFLSSLCAFQRWSNHGVPAGSHVINNA